MDNTVATWIALASVILGPVSGVLVALIANYRSKKEKLGSIEVTDKTLDINEKEADTHYWSAIVEGFAEQVKLVNQSHARLTEQNVQLQNKVDALETRINTEETKKQEMLAHIMALELLVPNPPGPPRRPWV